MHPALSVIVFTVLSGAGYGLLFLAAILAIGGVLPAAFWFDGCVAVLALAMISIGLSSSVLHLGRPERAWRAMSQWRSSWLSREGVTALVCYPAALMFATGWLWWADSMWWRLAAAITAVLAAATVACTAMIYASLKPVHQWRSAWVPAAYGVLALYSGCLWLDALRLGFDVPVPHLNLAAVALALAGAGIKIAYWRHIERTRSPATPESATGLGHIGKVRMLDPPHTQENYLLREMGFKIGRKHRRKLRRICIGLGFAAPALLVLIADFLAPTAAAAPALLAALLAMAGLLIERWLFFAEARHTVSLYYGAEAA
ncbi:MAG TPA: DmsC/YnfH family molybdoenzyme membrane anchor subunit [Candidatus Cybelea sp.]|nr:DmsC/YnfH family molybdoenzyme membrane anchor subunit [Candidatus Cybelea sp.]